MNVTIDLTADELVSARHHRFADFLAKEATSADRITINGQSASGEQLAAAISALDSQQETAVAEAQIARAAALEQPLATDATAEPAAKP